MRRYLLLLAPLVLIALAACSQPNVKLEPKSIAITPKTAAAQVGGEAIAFTATLEGLSGDVTWTLEPADIGTLSHVTGLETSYAPPASAEGGTTMVLTASVGNVSASASITLTKKGIHVDPVAGADANDGSVDTPVKTVRRALTLAEGGTTVYLSGGTYSEASGETYLEATDGEDGYLIPVGVEITANPSSSGVPVVIRNDGMAREAFRFVGDGKLSGVRLEGFNGGITAITGTQLINDVTMLAIGGFGITLDGMANLSCNDCNISLARGFAFKVDGSAKLRVDGVSFINSMSPANEPFLAAVYLVEDSQAEAVLDLVGGSTWGSYAVMGGKLTLRNVDVRLRSDQADNVYVGAEGQLTMLDGRVSGGYFVDGATSSAAISSYGTLTINGTVFENNPAGALSLDGGSTDIRNAVFQNIGDAETIFAGYGLNAIVVEGGAALKMRGTQIRNVKEAGNYNPPTPGTHGVGIYVTDTSGGIDLGTVAEPGRNHFRDCGLTCLQVGQNAGAHPVQAGGNSWTAHEQGADEHGRYAPELVDEGSWGRNYRVNSTSSIQF